jgi:hypothetical protein
VADPGLQYWKVVDATLAKIRKDEPNAIKRSQYV